MIWESVLFDQYDSFLIKRIFLREIDGLNIYNISLVCLLALIVFVPGVVRIRKKQSTVVDVFITYLICVCMGIMLLITIFRREAGYPRRNINPFPTWDNYGGDITKTIYTIFNIILFIPLGLLVRLRQYRVKNMKAFLITMCIGLATTCFIEGVQYLTDKGYFEFTDIINNILGCLIGLILGRLILGAKDGFLKGFKRDAWT